MAAIHLEDETRIFRWLEQGHNGEPPVAVAGRSGIETPFFSPLAPSPMFGQYTDAADPSDASR